MLEWETAWELLVQLTKTKAGLSCGSMLVKQMGGKLFQGEHALGKSGMCSGQLATKAATPFSLTHYRIK